jgi:hypothetical protein
LDLLGSLLLLLLALDGSALVLDTLLSPLAGGLSLGLVNLFELLEDVQYGCMVAAVVMASQEFVT